MTTANPKEPVIRSLAVRKAATQAAVTASKETGHPVDAQVKKIAEYI